LFENPFETALETACRIQSEVHRLELAGQPQVAGKWKKWKKLKKPSENLKKTPWLWKEVEKRRPAGLCQSFHFFNFPVLRKDNYAFSSFRLAFSTFCTFCGFGCHGSSQPAQVGPVCEVHRLELAGQPQVAGKLKKWKK
jgi:hypothetical protein